MAESTGKPHTILIADGGYETAAADLAADFPDLNVLCADGDPRALASGDVAGLIAGTATVDEAFLAALDNLQVVLKLGRSYYNINVESVRRRGLNFGCVPRKGPNCVAELAMTLIMALSKDLIISHDAVSLGAYRYRGLKPELTAERKIAFHWMHNTRVHEVLGKTLGIIGMGEIGCELARRASVMGMRNLYYKRTPLSAELEGVFDATYADLDHLLRESDYVCVATPHTPATEGMIGAAQIDMMKPKRLYRQYRSRRHHRRRSDDRCLARKPHRRRRVRCIHLRAAAGRQPALLAGQCDPLPAFRRRNRHQSQYRVGRGFG